MVNVFAHAVGVGVAGATAGLLAHILLRLVTRVLEHPKLWVIGSEDERRATNSLESRSASRTAPLTRSLWRRFRHHGYRPSKRDIVFQVLPDTLGLGPEVWRVLSKCNDKELPAIPQKSK